MAIEQKERLRALIRFLLEDAEILGEPDFTDGRDEDGDDDEGHHDEASAGGVPGPTMPLGVGPSYPATDRRRKKRKPAWKANASGFGGAVPYSKPKKNKN